MVKAKPASGTKSASGAEHPAYDVRSIVRKRNRWAQYLAGRTVRRRFTRKDDAYFKDAAEKLGYGHVTEMLRAAVACLLDSTACEVPSPEYLLQGIGKRLKKTEKKERA